jgi:large subunit ribosomal protein L2
MSLAFIGRVSNIYYRYTVFASFNGKYRIKKKEPSTRGIAMNPVDHPNGGRSKIKKPFRNP